MKVFWSKIIKPILEEVRPRSIVEVGSEAGTTTRNILEQYVVPSNARLSVIDPRPAYDHNEWMNRYNPHLKVFANTSLNALPHIKKFDVIFLDGDHNWYTVYNELKIIESHMRNENIRPIIMLHDVAWPYGRRDLYYSIDDIPPEFRHPCSKSGMFPGTSELVDLGFNRDQYNADHEGGERNGVLTAVEDFLKETSFNFSYHSLDCWNGLGILVPDNAELDSKISLLLDDWKADNCSQEIEKSKEEHRAPVYSAAVATATPEISLCMIVKNEEQVLERCLNSIRDLVDEIIIVDTGSTDRTKEIASAFTSKIFDFSWENDFASARNFSFSQATKEYILWLDADDIIAEEDRNKLLSLKQNLSSDIDSVIMKYHLEFDKNNNPTASIERNRLVKRSRNFKWIGKVHEYLEVSGTTLVSDVSVRHDKLDLERDKDRNLNIYRQLLESGTKLSSRELFYYANELADHSLLKEALPIYEQFLKEGNGWIEDIISACLRLSSIHFCITGREAQIDSLLKTFQYDKPRAEVCCQLGHIFLSDNNIDRAIFWYDLATKLEPPIGIKGLSHDNSTWTWLPHLQLCLCYDKLQNFEKAQHHNEKAAEYYPTHPAVINNRAYFESKTN